ncbi:NACHT domain-containing protein [Solwaraspora sp. WMMA2080]|uniref:NACHT domain-containing protein n=1 Tax=unclassified Solwaraspora TaxID=2627926 RepID=UPI00248B095C|nr:MULTISPECIES: NACHT domain-containing protein [unclassified Solwaraspora]WBB95226.1 NACHT domain-containing protein [Solwaraspora sp. WMMA2059]WBC20868.1 NACHT domain-containing protein [Solwaraspora sp. WMMA2080]
MPVEGNIVGLITKSAMFIFSHIERTVNRKKEESEKEFFRAYLNSDRVSKSVALYSISEPNDIDKTELQNFLSGPTARTIVRELLTTHLATNDFDSRRLRVAWQIGAWSEIKRVQAPILNPYLDKIFDCIEGESRRLSELFKEKCPRIAGDITNDAKIERVSNILESIERHLSSLKSINVAQIDSEADLISKYRKQAARAHGSIEPPDFERRRRLNYSTIYVSPKFAESGRRETELSLEDLIEELDRTVILGDPGGGKSTAANVITTIFAATPTYQIPFFVLLRDFAGEMGEKSIVDYLAHRSSSHYQVDLPKELIQRLLDTGRVLVVFDGLDELLDTSRRREVADRVELFCARYPLCAVLVTSRLVGYQRAPMDPKEFRVIEISRFDDQDVQLYAEKWFSQENLSSAEKQLAISSFVEESKVSPDLRSNPLMLALLCIIYRGEHFIPRNRPAVYERCATLLFDKWDSSRRIYSNLQAGHAVDPAMKYLAYWMLVNDSTGEGVTEHELVDRTTTYLKGYLFETDDQAREAAREFVEFCRGRAWVFNDAGTTADGEVLYKFTHRTFLEYFAAYHITRLGDSPEQIARLLAPHILREEWDIVAQLATQITDRHNERGGERIVRFLLAQIDIESPTQSALVSFVSRCLSFLVLPPTQVRQIVSEAYRLMMQHLWIAPEVSGTSGQMQAMTAILEALTTPNKSIIQDELISQVRSGLDSDQTSASVDAAAFAHIGISAAMPRRSRVRNEVRLSFTKAIQDYRIKIEQLATVNHSLYLGLLSLEDFDIAKPLAKHGTEWLFAEFEYPGWGLIASPYAGHILRTMAGTRQNRNNLYWKQVEGISQFLLQLDGPPWGNHPGGDRPLSLSFPMNIRRIVGAGNSESSEDLSPNELNVGGVLLFIMLEGLGRRLLVEMPVLESSLGRLQCLMPLIEVRTGQPEGRAFARALDYFSSVYSSEKSSMLPLLRRWARREVNFLTHTSIAFPKQRGSLERERSDSPVAE